MGPPIVSCDFGAVPREHGSTPVLVPLDRCFNIADSAKSALRDRPISALTCLIRAKHDHNSPRGFQDHIEVAKMTSSITQETTVTAQRTRVAPAPVTTVVVEQTKTVSPPVTTVVVEKTNVVPAPVTTVVVEKTKTVRNDPI
jgi:hypothetical protein